MRFAKAALASLMAIGAFQASVAYANDVVLMRRQVDPKDSPIEWVSGEWSQCSNSCGTGQQTRVVQCVQNGDVATADSACGPDRPASARSCYDVSACSFRWKEGAWSGAAGCGDVVQTRAVSCVRSDGQSVSNDLCPRPEPDSARTVADVGTCSYSWHEGDWGSWSSGCSASAARSRDVWCQRSDGGRASDSDCSAAGVRPASTDVSAQSSQCGYDWRASAWSDWSSSCQAGATRTRTVSCVRSDGVASADASCGGSRPDAVETSDQYGGCSFSWKPGDWGAVVPGCGDSTRTRVVQCVRADGTATADASCDAGSRPASSEAAKDYSTCSFTWTQGAWSAPSATCGAATSTRSVQCRSSDGRVVADSSCAGPRPDASRSTDETAGCSFAWSPPSAWGQPVPACGPTVQNRSASCVRSDGAAVPDSSCDASLRPVLQQAAVDYSACTYGWAADAYGAWSTSCGQATQTRTVSCRSSDGRVVADSQCPAGARPAASQSAYQTSGCGYSWTAGSFGAAAPACGATTQTRPVSCMRSDGQAVADALCPAASRPSPTQPATDYATCTASWVADAWGGWSTSCGSATSSRAVACVRSDGTTVGDASCPSASRPASTQSAYQTSGCGYDWVPGVWSAAASACGASSQTRPVSCVRSDGTAVADSFCPTASRPATTQPSTDYSSCTTSWIPGAWSAWSSTCSATASHTRAVPCVRSDGTVVADTACTAVRPGVAETTAVYSGCGYTWQYSSYGAPAAACGASTQTRSVWCQRSDGATVADASCSAAGARPTTSQSATDYTACSYGWAYGGWSTTSQTCGSVSQSRSVWCQRQDGTHVADSSCTASSKPGATQSYSDYSSCSYSAVNPGSWSGWSSTCSASASHTRTYQCRRSDGAIVAGSECTSRGISLSETASQAVYDGCGYSVTGWSGYSFASSCSASTTATQTATGCRRSDGTSVAVSECSAHGVAITQTSQQSNLASCGYSWQGGAWSAQQNVCTSGTQTRSVWCQRSDGATVADSFCTAAKLPTSQGYTNTNGCTWSYQIFSDWSQPQGCGAVTQTRSVACVRSDGTWDSNDRCPGGAAARPADSQSATNYKTCSYWVDSWSGWGSCSNGSQSRTGKCWRGSSPNVIVDDSACISRGMSMTQTQGCAVSCSWKTVSQVNTSGSTFCGPNQGQSGHNYATGQTMCGPAPQRPAPGAPDSFGWSCTATVAAASNPVATIGFGPYGMGTYRCTCQ